MGGNDDDDDDDEKLNGETSPTIQFLRCPFLVCYRGPLCPRKKEEGRQRFHLHSASWPAHFFGLQHGPEKFPHQTLVKHVPGQEAVPGLPPTQGHASVTLVVMHS